MRRIAMALALGLAAVSTTASAQPEPVIPEGVTTDRSSADAWAVSLDASFSNFVDDSARNATRADFYGQLLGQLGAHRAGVYLSLPYARLVSGPGEFGRMSKVGHMELGGLFVTAIGTNTDAVLRGGMAFEVSEDQRMESLALFFTGFGRLSEAVISAPDVTWMRLSGSLLHHATPYFLRADVGLDVPFDEAGDDVLFARANLAAGIDLESVALLGELANLAIVTGESDDELLSTFAFTVRLSAGILQTPSGGTFSPCLSLVLPLDDQLRELVDFVVVVGVRAAGN